jgi:hypothetical protein
MSEAEQARVDEQGRESFPASDSPSHDPRREYTDPEFDEESEEDEGEEREGQTDGDIP